MRFGKESIKWALIVSEHIGAEEIGDELDHVYAQADKADEYEAKAKAYDSLKNKLEKEVETLTGEVSGFPYVDAPIENTISHFEHVLEMMKNYESGESDV